MKDNRTKKDNSRNRRGRSNTSRGYDNEKGKKFGKEYEAQESNSELGRDSDSTKQKRGGRSNGSRMSNNRGNDPSYYNSNPELLKAAANINFSYPGGMVYRPGTAGRISYSDNSSKYVGKEVIPSVVTATIIPTFGNNTEPNSVLNVVAQQMYTNVRYYNSGSRNYDSNDLALYLLGMADVFSYINYLSRLYAFMSTYSPLNRALPRLLVEANFVDFDDLLGNTAQFRKSIMLLIDKAASFVAPAVFKLFERRASMFTKVFCESGSIRDQLYMYVPEGFMRFTLDADGAGSLEFTPFGVKQVGSGGWQNAKYTMNELIEFGHSLIDAYFRDEDSGIISGDLAKAYGDRIYYLQYPPEVPVVDFTMDQEVLNQFKNALPICVTDFANVNPFFVNQSADKSYLISGTTVGISEMYSYYTLFASGEGSQTLFKRIALDLEGGDQLFSFNSPTPTIDEIVETTRLHPSYTFDDTGNFVKLECGSELVNRITVWSPSATTTGYTPINIITSFFNYVATDPTSAAVAQRNQILINHLFSITSCKWIPKINAHYCQDATQTSAVITDQADYRMFQTANYTFVGMETLRSIHEAVLFNQLHTDAIAKAPR